MENMYEVGKKKKGKGEPAMCVLNLKKVIRSQC